jgi:hypothetical protein
LRDLAQGGGRPFVQQRRDRLPGGRRIAWSHPPVASGTFGRHRTPATLPQRGDRLARQSGGASQGTIRPMRVDLQQAPGRGAPVGQGQCQPLLDVAGDAAQEGGVIVVVQQPGQDGVRAAKSRGMCPVGAVDDLHGAALYQDRRERGVGPREPSHVILVDAAAPQMTIGPQRLQRHRDDGVAVTTVGRTW